MDGLHHAEGVAISDDGMHVYVAAEKDDGISAFARNPINGTLTFLTTYIEGVGGVTGVDKATAVTVSPDGDCVFAGGESPLDAFAVFDRDSGTGLLTFVEIIAEGAGGVTGIERVGAITVSPDSAHVYVVGRQSDAVAVFERTPGLCELNFVQAMVNGAGGVENMQRPEGLAISASGDHVYVTAGHDDALVVFSRNAITGGLAFIESHENRRNGIAGLDNPEGVAVSPDGTSVFVGGRSARALVRFERDPGTGTLRYISKRQNNVNIGYDDVLGLVEGVAVSPDSLHIYSADAGTNGVGAFELQSSVACSGVPLAGCRAQTQAGVGTILVKDSSNDKSDQVKWQWKKGELTQSADFGDIQNTASQALCVYDPGALVFEARALPGACRGRECWTTKSSGLKHKNKERSPEGMSDMSVKDGLDTKAKVTARAKGELATLPSLPIALPVTVQLQTSDGECWSSTYTTPLINTFDQFKAKND